MTLKEMAVNAAKDYEHQIILAVVDGKLRELSNEAEGTDISFVTTATTVGNETYKRSVLFMMLAAVSRIATKEVANSIDVQFSLSHGLYCTIGDQKKVDKDFIDKVRTEMQQMVSEDLVIHKMRLSNSEAVKRFNSYGMTDKGRLFNYRQGSYVNIYELGGYEDYYYGYMAPSTGMLKYFELYSYDKGFVLQLPRKKSPCSVAEFKPTHKLFGVLDESSDWAKVMNCETVADLNKYITSGNIQELVLVQEALQEQKIAQIARQIADNPEKKIIMIAGPSSSGKTTFSHRLSVQLKACGLKPHPIPVDNYFVERSQTPLDENGEYDFEALHAVDIELFNDHMGRLLKGEEVEMPIFNFKMGRKEYNGKKLQLGKGDILVIEGIHCLNDELSYTLPKESKYKIYISALTQLNVDEHNRIATTDGRLIRRMVRDFRTRGASPKRTLAMWESVRRGEERNIFPYQEEADVMFNSALIYELAVLKPYAQAILYNVEEHEPEYQEAKRLLKFLQYFLTFSGEGIPNNSIVREFIGGGCFEI